VREPVGLFRRFRAALSRGASDPSPGFMELVRQHSLPVLDRQLRLDDIAGEADWWIDQGAGTITLGDLIAQIQFIGSESEKPHNWMWAWANGDVDPPLAAAVGRLRAAHDHLMEMAQPHYRMPRRIEGHAIATVAAGLSNADAYYRGPHPGGGVFVMLSLPADQPLPDWSPLRRAGATLRAAPLALFVPVGPDEVTAYVRSLGLQPDVSGGAISVRGPEGELVVRFDRKGRITSVEN